MLKSATNSLVNWEALADPVSQKARFRDAEPFPHIVIDDALSSHAARIAGEYPGPDSEVWDAYAHEFQEGKRICSDPSLFPGLLAQLATELMQARFLQWLEGLVDVPGLIPDPYYEGGGLHCSGPGGVLRPHTDFHLYSRLSLFRRVNVLLYLNSEWELSWGGCLELYSSKEAQRAVTTIEPIWGRMVIFLTDDRSVHGFPSRISEGRWRQSLALYYYTSKDQPGFGGDYSTYWTREDGVGRRYRLRRRVHSALLAVSRGIAIMAHRCDPDVFE